MIPGPTEPGDRSRTAGLWPAIERQANVPDKEFAEHFRCGCAGCSAHIFIGEWHESRGRFEVYGKRQG